MTIKCGEYKKIMFNLLIACGEMLFRTIYLFFINSDGQTYYICFSEFRYFLNPINIEMQQYIFYFDLYLNGLFCFIKSIAKMRVWI